MQESNQSNQTEAFWNTSKDGSGETYTRLSDDKEIDVEKLKARFRHRVVGVIVLVAALVTVLPIFFEEPAIEGDRHAQTAIPPIAKEPFYKMELAVNERPRPSPPADQSALRDLSKPNVVTDAPEAHPTPELEQNQAAQSYAPRTDGSLYIQVLATSSEASAMREMARYQAMGIPVYSLKAQKKSATLWRVRLGLFKTKEEADQVAKFLDSRKISHLPVQVEESAKGNLNRIAPVRTLKSAAQEAHQKSQPAAQAAKPVAAPKAETKPAQTVKTPAKTATKPAAKTAPKASQTTGTKVKTPAAAPKKQESADPLADLLKSTRQQDPIAQKLREAGHR